MTFALLLAPKVALCAETSVVVVAEGPDARAAREEIGASLAGGYRVVEPASLMEALARQGQKGALKGSLPAAKKRAALFEEIRKASRAAQVDDVVIVVTSRAANGRKGAVMYVVDAAGDASPQLKAFVGSADHALAGAVSTELTTLHPAPPPPPPVTDVPEPAAAVSSAGPAPGSWSASPEPRDAIASPEASRPMHQVGREWFTVDAGVGGGMRNFSYNQGITGNLRDYHLSAAPLVEMDGAVYPLADSNGFLASKLGLVFGYAQAVALESMSDDGGKVSTHWARWYAGGRARLRTGAGPDAVVVGVTGAYAADTFTFDSNLVNANYPSVDYRFVRANADVRIPIGRFALTANAGYLFVLSAGAVADRFPHASVGGVEAAAGGAFRIRPGLEARATVSYRRFFYAANPVPGDTFVAGGAVDELASIDGSLAYVF